MHCIAQQWPAAAGSERPHAACWSTDMLHRGGQPPEAALLLRSELGAGGDSGTAAACPSHMFGACRRRLAGVVIDPRMRPLLARPHDLLHSSRANQAARRLSIMTVSDVALRSLSTARHQGAPQAFCVSGP
eukprot:scaffold38118_cov32-Tisochrysis_lutea.AAC.8